MSRPSIRNRTPVAVHFAGACRTLGIEPKFGSTFGGSDGNTMMQHGIPCAVLSCGMYDVHSVRSTRRWGYCEWGEIDRGTDYAGARSEYRVKLKNVDIAERLYYFTKTII